MDPFLFVVASAFLDRVEIIYYKIGADNGQSPKITIRIGQRAERGEGPTMWSKTHRVVFDEKINN